VNIFYVFEKVDFYVVRDGVGISTSGLGTHNKSTKFQPGGGGNYVDSQEWLNILFSMN